jgi:hypothetical protein
VRSVPDHHVPQAASKALSLLMKIGAPIKGDVSVILLTVHFPAIAPGTPYRKVIRDHAEGLLWMAISETRQASRERRITKTKGAYFMATVKDLAARWAFASSTPSP